jgi:predicted PhzF superfamily epimerase YddE/YHI9
VASEAQVRFLSQSGPLFAARREGLIELDFPARLEEPTAAPAGLSRALGATPLYFGRNVDDYLVLVEDEEAVRRLRPDFAALAKVSARGVIVTAPASTAGFDFVSRFFAPAVGIDEDPVTGSAHCCLAPFWKARLGKESLVGVQASARGGSVRVRVAGERVFLGGSAVLVFRGELVA